MSMSADLWTVRQAVLALPITCRYHGEEFGKLGRLSAAEGGQPRCESCRPAWRRMCGLAALDRVDEVAHRVHEFDDQELV